jgi:hypothetical protein
MKATIDEIDTRVSGIMEREGDTARQAAAS